MKKYMMLAALAAGALLAWGKPGVHPVKVTMPDGTVKTIAKRGHCRNKLHPSVPAFAKDFIRETRGPGLFDYSFPTKGKQKALVILAEFSDVKFNSKNKSQYSTPDPKAYFTDMLNKEGFDTYGATGSARDWFLDNSNGIFDPEFDVYGPVTLSHPVKYYGANDKKTDEDVLAYQMVIDACRALDSEIDFKEYDRDNDGYVDNVYVFYAGYGEADTENNEDTIWPHSWNISWGTSPNGYTPGNPLRLDDVYIDRYACSNETCGIIGYDYRDNPIYADRPDGIGTFVHEFSHVMGLPDLYCVNYPEDEKDDPFTPGEYSVMDYGPYNNDGMTPPNYSAYERYALDWLTPKMLTTGEFSINNMADANEAYIIKTERDQEFYLLENRQQSGWDKYIPGHGMLVWHIDFDESVFYDNTVNDDKDHQYVDLVEADNVRSDASTAADPFPGTRKKTSFGFKTTPALKSWSGKNLGVELTNIAENNNVISFSAAVDSGNAYNGSSDVADIIADAGMQDADIYNLQGIYVGKATQGATPELAPGVYIFKSGEKSIKRVIR